MIVTDAFLAYTYDNRHRDTDTYADFVSKQARQLIFNEYSSDRKRNRDRADTESDGKRNRDRAHTEPQVQYYMCRVALNRLG